MRKRLMLFLAAGLGFTACSGGTLSTDAPRKGTAEARPSATQNSLSAVGEEEARALAESGHLADLQWPNFSQHRDAVKEFYEWCCVGWLVAPLFFSCGLGLMLTFLC